VALLLLFALPHRALAQSAEPTPFWGGPPPPEEAKVKKRRPPSKAPARVKTEPAKRQRKSAPPAPAAVDQREPPREQSGPAPAQPEERAPTPSRRAQKPAPLPEPQALPASQVAPVVAPVLGPEVSARQPPGQKELPRTLEVEPQRGPAALEAPRGSRSNGALLGLDLVAGAWGKGLASGGPRAYDFAYGLRAGWALLPEAVELDLVVVRAGGTQGNPFASATATHTLIGLRAFAVIGRPQLALLLGAGAGPAFAQTHYSLQGTSGAPQTLEATSLKFVLLGSAALRLRLRAFEARVELSPMLRDGRLELLPLLALGLGLW